MDLQIVDVEAGQVRPAYEKSSWRAELRQNVASIDGDDVVYVPVRKRDDRAAFFVRVWCRSSEGRSVCVVVCDARREVYRKLQPHLGDSPQRRDAAQRALQEVLDDRRGAHSGARCEVVTRCSTSGWQPEPEAWAKFLLTSAAEVDAAFSDAAASGWFSAKGLERCRSEELRRLAASGRGGAKGLVFDAKTAHRTLDLRTDVLRLLGVRAGGGLRLSEELCGRARRPQALSCDLLLQARLEELAGGALELSTMAPLRILSFDLECFSASGAFPLARRADDAIITVGLYRRTLGAPEQDGCLMLCLGDARSSSEAGEEDWGLAASEVRSFPTEAELLLAFAEELQRSDADVVVGYNTCAFDWRYLRDRVQLLTLAPHRAAFDAVVRATLPAARVSLEGLRRRVEELAKGKVPRSVEEELAGLGCVLHRRLLPPPSDAEKEPRLAEVAAASRMEDLDEAQRQEAAYDAARRAGLLELCSRGGWRRDDRVGAPEVSVAAGAGPTQTAVRELFRAPAGRLRAEAAKVPELRPFVASAQDFERAARLLGYSVEEDLVCPWPDPLAAGGEEPRRSLTMAERSRCLRLARRRDEETCPAEQELASSALGDNPLCYPSMVGRVNLDLWLYLKRENLSDLENLKLNTVAKHFLNDEKRDLPPKQIFSSYLEGPGGRWRVAAYCRQDCKLVLDLVEKIEALPSIWEMAKVTCTAPEDILFRGQQLKVYTQLVLQALETNYLVEDREEDKEAERSSEKYEGATVVEPLPGYYHEPVFCLDFASLYPSLMRTKNISPDTLVAAGAAAAVPVHEISVRAGVAHRFVKGSVRVGLLPRILEQLLTERKRVKRLMEAEKDPRRRALLNSKQLALKISANSVYGACGATQGRLSFRECAEATTAAGRDAIAFTCSYISALPGHGIVYGDTDSAFLKIPPEHHALGLRELFGLGERLAAAVTQAIADAHEGELCHIKLEMEKMLRPLVLYKKKRYTGLCFEDPDKPPKVLTKGLEMVRKDACALTKEAQRGVVDALLKRTDPRQAAAVVLEALQRLLAVPPGGPFDALKQSKSLKADYKAEESQAHWRVKELMREREPGSEPRVGDRVEYVVVASKADRVVDKVEDVAHAQAKGLPPDWLHYFEAIETSLMRLLDVPLRAVDERALVELQRACGGLRRTAAEQTERHAMARQGARWVHGHRAGKSGAVQLRLDAVSAFAPPSRTDLERAPLETRAQKRARTSAAAQAAAAKQRPLASFLRAG
jgi:DNA polymerase elongation subunit (family B)